MQPIIELAKSKEQNAAAAFGQARAELGSQQARLEELQNYRIEYIARFNQQALLGMDALKVKDFQQFHVVDKAEQHVEQKREHWLNERRQLGVYDQLKDRYQSAEQRDQDRLEQKDTDERAQRSTAYPKQD